MKLSDHNREEMLNLSLFCKQNPISRDVDGIRPILKIIDEYAGDLRPQEVFDGKSYVNYSHDQVIRILSKQGLEFKNVLNLRRIETPKVSYSLDFTYLTESPVNFWFELVVPFSYYHQNQFWECRISSLLSLIRGLATTVCPSYGYCHPTGDLSLATDPHRDNPIAPLQVYEMYWLNIYGPELIEMVGKERILSTPAAQIDELICDHGIVLFLISTTPFDYISYESRKAQALALTHLRRDLKYEDVLAQLLDRSTTLAPAQRDWDPDIADLLELILNNNVSLGDRQIEIKKFNQYRPPEISEWLPVNNTYLSDLNDVGEAIETYEFYAEKLVALLHKSIPEISENQPESLPAIDYHFWSYNYPARLKREVIESDLVSAIGGYIGDLLVRRLNGRWVPRQNLYEAQVVLGERAWLPFLRAKHYMQTQQSAIDFSLTQFYHVARRFTIKLG